MKRPACLSLLAFAILVSLSTAADHEVTRVLPAGQRPADSRLGRPKTLDDYFPFTPPATKQEWEARRRAVREQVLMATGLWPMPPRTPLEPVIHGTIDRGQY